MFNNKDFILHKRGAVSKEDCTYLIDFFESNPGMQQPGTVGNAPPNHRKKKDTEIVLNFSFDSAKLRSVIPKYLSSFIEEYKKEYPYINELSLWNLVSVYKLQRYYPGEGYFVLHCENGGPHPDESLTKRLLAWMIYLNDVKDGGYTEFPTQNKKFQPRRGDVLIWPAYFTHPHRGITSKSQTKYIVTGWFSFK